MKIKSEARVLTENGDTSKNVNQSENSSAISRFNTLTKSFQEATSPVKAQEGSNLAWRLLHRVEILPGEWIINIDGKNLNCFTQYSLVRDNQNKEFSWTTYENVQPIKINLKNISFKEGTVHSPIPLNA